MILVAGVTVIVLRRKEAETTDAFALGKRDYTYRVILLSTIATFVGPSYSIGVVDRTYQFTFLFAFVYIVATFHLLFTSKYLVPRLRSADFANDRTVGDVMARKYGRAGALLSGLFVVLQYIAFVAVLCLGGAKALDIGFGIPVPIGIFLVAIVVGAYSFACGMPGVLKTDVVQAGFLALFLLLSIGLSLVAISRGLPPSERLLMYDGASLPLVELISFFFAFLLGEALHPIYLTRVFMAKDEATASSALKHSALVGMIWFSVLGLCGYAIHSILVVQGGTQGTLLLAIQNLGWHPAIISLLLGIFVASLLGIVMSTLDSVLNAAGVAFADDVVGTFLKLSDERQLQLTRMMVILLVLIGAVLSAFFSNIVDLLFFAYTLWVPTIVAPLARAILTRKQRLHPLNLWGGVSSGVAAYYTFDAYLGKLFPAIVVGFVVNLVMTLLPIGAKGMPNKTVQRT